MNENLILTALLNRHKAVRCSVVSNPERGPVMLNSGLVFSYLSGVSLTKQDLILWLGVSIKSMDCQKKKRSGMRFALTERSKCLFEGYC